MTSRMARMRRFRVAALTTFLAAICAALLAVWLWDPRWIATAGVLLFAAGIFGAAALP